MENCTRGTKPSAGPYSGRMALNDGVSGVREEPTDSRYSTSTRNLYVLPYPL